MVFWLFYLITQEKNGIFALERSRQLGVSYNAAWGMKHKLMQAMKERDDETPLSGFVQLDDVYWTKAHLISKSLVISDGLACFKGIEKANVFHQAIVTGDGADYVELPYFQWVNTMISNVKNSMHGTYHAINRKHLPRYLGEFCFKFNRRFNLEKCLNNSFIQVSRQHRCLIGC